VSSVVENPAIRFGDGPDDERFIVAGTGRIAMRYAGTEPDIETLTDWAESVGWTTSIGATSLMGSYHDVVLTEPTSGATATIRADSYVVLEEGVFSERPLTEYEPDTWDLVRDEQEKGEN
jgi:hypothetical protein